MPGVCPVVLLTLTVGCFGRSILLPQILCLAWLWTLAARACFFCKSPKKSWLVQWKMTRNFKWKEPHMGDSLPKGPWPKKASHQPRVPPQDYLDHPLWKIPWGNGRKGLRNLRNETTKKTPIVLKGGTLWIIIVFTPLESDPFPREDTDIHTYICYCICSHARVELFGESLRIVSYQ